MSQLDSLRSVLEETLKDLYSAETQITKALPKMARGASTPELKRAFEKHLEVTKMQVERLERICKELGIKPTGKKCAGMEGLLKEGEEVLKEKGTPTAKDAALIVAAQKVEHYEIAGYGSARTFAQHLGLQNTVALLQTTLNEESQTDEELTAIAENSVNWEAEQEDDEEESASPGRGARMLQAVAAKMRGATSSGQSKSSAGRGSSSSSSRSSSSSSAKGAAKGAASKSSSSSTSAKGAAAGGPAKRSAGGASSKSSSAGTTAKRSTGGAAKKRGGGK